MRFDEIEERAREWMFYASHFGLLGEIVNGRWSSEQVTDMARTLLAVLPVVRIAEAWSGTPPSFAGDLDVKLHEAVHEMRARLGKGDKPLTLDEVKAALDAGAKKRAAAERTMKRSPRR